MSSFVSASAMRTMPVLGSEISLTLPSTAVWLCVSMMPGITNLPVASMTRAPAGAGMSLPTAAIFEPVLGSFKRPTIDKGGRDLGDLGDPIVSTRFAMAYLRDIMTRRPTLREALTEYNGGPAGRHLQYYRTVMGAYVEILERPELQCRYRPVPKQPPPSLGLLAQI